MIHAYFMLFARNHTYIFIGFMYFWQRMTSRTEISSSRRKRVAKYIHDNTYGGAREASERVRGARMRRSAVTSSPLDATFRSPPPPGSVARRPLSDVYVFSFLLARLIARLSPWHFRQSEFCSFRECRETQCERKRQSARYTSDMMQARLRIA